LTKVVVKLAGKPNALGFVGFDQQRLDRGVVPESHVPHRLNRLSRAGLEHVARPLAICKSL
jgi:hypothetical protein